VLALAMLGGCVSWASYPAEPGEVAVKNPNSPAVEELMMAALKWTVNKFPPNDAAGAHTGGGRIALNLPVGVKPKVYRRIAEAAGGGAEPLTPENKNLPIYHVKEFRIRGDEAQVNIVFPAASLGASPTGGPVYQELKIGLTGGLSLWRVISFREWGPGAQPPDLNFYVPEPEPAKPALPGGP
jgi:hypothetical protein